MIVSAENGINERQLLPILGCYVDNEKKPVRAFFVIKRCNMWAAANVVLSTRPFNGFFCPG